MGKVLKPANHVVLMSRDTRNASSGVGIQEERRSFQSSSWFLNLHERSLDTNSLSPVHFSRFFNYPPI